MLCVCMLQGGMFRAFAHSDSLKCHVAVCCSVLQCVAVCCSDSHCVCACCRVVSVEPLLTQTLLSATLMCVAVCCSVLQCVAFTHNICVCVL